MCSRNCITSRCGQCCFQLGKPQADRNTLGGGWRIGIGVFVYLGIGVTLIVGDGGMTVGIAVASADIIGDDDNDSNISSTDVGADIHRRRRR